MQRSLILLVAAVALSHATVRAARPAVNASSTVEFPGGPPSIRIAEKARGEITRSAWDAATAVELAGCVADARVTSMTLVIQGARGLRSRVRAAPSAGK